MYLVTLLRNLETDIFQSHVSASVKVICYLALRQYFFI